MRWIVKMRRYGLAEAYRVGGRILYSRHQLNCLREAERQHDEIFLSKRKKWPRVAKPGPDTNVLIPY